MWGKNEQIANPHWIYPGDRIRLYLKSGVKNIDDVVKKDMTVASAEPEKEPPYFYYNAMDAISFLKKAPIPPSGKVYKGSRDDKLIGTGDNLYIKGSGDTIFRSGSRYTAYRVMRLQKNKKFGDYIGYQYYPTGVVEITGEESGVIMAKVVRSYRPIEIGNILLPYEKRAGKIVLAESISDLEGRILGSEQHDTIFGDTAIAFIDKGDENGVKAGQHYTLYYNETKRLHPNRSWKSKVLPTVDFGSFLVLHTEADNATVLITSSKESVHPGSNFRSAED